MRSASPKARGTLVRPSGAQRDSTGRRGVILWDFDGTLATREGMWSGALLEVLDQHLPDHGITIDQVRPYMRQGFPWHTPEIPHPHLADADAWWEEVRQVFTRAMQELDVGDGQLDRLSTLAQARYVDPTIGWHLFDETIDTLTRAREAGWSNHLLSNHVPELPQIIEHLGVGQLLDATHNSAITGYEKPHPEAFRLALAHARKPRSRVWMVGDNPVADIEGAREAGIRSVLVRSKDPNAAHELQAESLSEAFGLIDSLSSD